VTDTGAAKHLFAMRTTHLPRSTINMKVSYALKLFYNSTTQINKNVIEIGVRIRVIAVFV